MSTKDKSRGALVKVRQHADHLNMKAHKLEQRNDQLQARVDELEKSLKFYANKENWKLPTPYIDDDCHAWHKPSAISDDNGKMAQQALGLTDSGDR